MNPGDTDGQPFKARIEKSFSTTFQTIFSPLTLFIWAACVLLGTIAGPFGTFIFTNWAMRAFYWTMVISFGVLAGYSSLAVSLALVGRRRPMLLDIVMIAIMSVTFSPLLWIFTRLVHPAGAQNAPPLLTFAGYVTLCIGITVLGRRFLPGFEPNTYEFLPTPRPGPAVAALQRSEPRLMRRLPETMQGRVLRISARDHFVQVVTETGTETLRMRLADAISEMEPITGFRVHRSHWVAENAVTRIDREDTNKMFVLLDNSDRIPISRNYRAKLKEAGLI